MQNYQVAVIPGDGIGREVIPEGMRVLEKRVTVSRRAFLKGSGLTAAGVTTLSVGGLMLPARDALAAELTHLGTLTDGAELTSSITEPTDAHLYTRYVHERQHAIGAGFLSLNMRSIDN